jgi:hypothetical protein
LPISIKQKKNPHCIKGIQVCSNTGPGHLQRGDNHKNAKIGWGHLKIFSQVPLGQRYSAN